MFTYWLYGAGKFEKLDLPEDVSSLINVWRIKLLRKGHDREWEASKQQQIQDSEDCYNMHFTQVA